MAATGGVAQTIGASTPVQNIVPVVIGGTLGMGGATNGPTYQDTKSKAEGGSFGLSVGLFNLDQ